MQDPAKPAENAPLPRDPKGRYLPGHSYPPGPGRPKGLAAMVRALTDDGRTIIEIVAGMLVDPDTSGRDRLEAAKILLDRGYGRAVETSLTVNATAGEALELAALADSQLEQLVSGLRSRSTAASLPVRIPAEQLDDATIRATITVSPAK